MPSAYLWQPQGQLSSVRLPLDIVERLWLEVMQAFKAVPRRGLEIGGLLLGRIEQRSGETVVTIDGYETLECEHVSGPSFHLSDHDRECVERQLAKHGKRVVGWFRSNTRPEFAPDEHDNHVFASYVRQNGSVFLLIRPEKQAVPLAAFFRPEAGELPLVPALTFPFHAMELSRPSYPKVEIQRPGGARAGAAAGPKEPLWASWMWVPVVASAMMMGAAFLRYHDAASPSSAPIVRQAPLPVPVAANAAKPSAMTAPVARREQTADRQQQEDDATELRPQTREYLVRPADAPAASEKERPTPAEPVAAAVEPRQEPAPAPISPPPPPVQQVRAVKPPQQQWVSARITAEPVTGSRLSRTIAKIPLVSRLHRKNAAYTPPKPLKQATVSIAAANWHEMDSEVPVDVKVLVNRTGKVEAVELLNGSHHKELAVAATDAARRWTFVPARNGKTAVEGEMVLHFRFGPELRASSR